MKYNIIKIQEVDSTNAQLKRWCKEEELPDKTVLLALRQTGGLGRKRGDWSSPEGGLYASIFFTRLPANVPILSSVAVAAALLALGFDAKIKWPNDILIGEKKICGILCESGKDVTGNCFVICGFGINVNNQSFPEEIQNKATSLLLAGGMPLKVDLVLATVLQSFDQAMREKNLLEEYKRLCVTLQKKVRILGEDKLFQAVDIDQSGQLILQDENGNERTVSAGEVSIRGEHGYI